MNTNTEKLITTGCCDDSNKHKVVRLNFLKHYSCFELYSTLKPIWVSRGYDMYKYNDIDQFMVEAFIEVKFCPFCAKPTPEIVLNENTGDRKIYDSDTGDYCETCTERSMCCTCLPAEFRWKPIGVDIILPEEEIRDDE